MNARLLVPVLRLPKCCVKYWKSVENRVSQRLHHVGEVVFVRKRKPIAGMKMNSKLSIFTVDPAYDLHKSGLICTKESRNHLSNKTHQR